VSSPRVITERARISSTWEAHCAGRSDLTPFQRPEFLDGLSRSVPWKPVWIAWDDSLVQWSFVRRRGPSSELVLPPFCPFSSLLFAPEATTAQRTEALAQLGSREAHLPSSRLFALDPRDWETAGRPEAPSGLMQREMATWEVGLAPVEDLLPLWSASARRTWNKHREVYRFAEGGSISDLVDLVVSGYVRHGRRPPMAGTALVSWAQDLVGSGLARLYTVSEGDSMAAGVVTLVGPSRAWYWLAGSRPGPAMTILLGHLFGRLHDQGIPTFDFMGANTPSISEFKRRFGGRLVTYPHWHRKTPVASIFEQAARIRHGWRR
jgi:hypothetical protein